MPWHCEVATEVLPEEASEKEVLELLDKAMPHDIPFLQYTSGSTGKYIPSCTHVTSAELVMVMHGVL